jgi:Tol biopolymer transport system component
LDDAVFIYGWSLAGDRILFELVPLQGGEVDLYSIEVTTGNLINVTKSGKLESFVMSPDDKEVAFVTQSGDANQVNLYIGSVNGAIQQKIATLSGDITLVGWQHDSP